MTTIGAFDAKTHLNALLKRVARGETIRITLRGVPIAKLVPDNDGEQANPVDVVQGIRQLRRGTKLGKISLRDLIDEGRRY
jgi:prevent-host-death family protein